MLRKTLKQEIRRLAAQAVLQEKGRALEDVGGPRIGRGVRLRAGKGMGRRDFAVRTTDDRKVGLTPTAEGGWQTVDEVDEVVVAAIAKNNPAVVEIYGFEKAVLVEAFDARLKLYKGLKKGRSGKLPPVFMSLDPHNKDPKGIRSNLKAKAEWTAKLPLTMPATTEVPAVETWAQFRRRLEKEYAARIGEDPNNVWIEFHHVDREKSQRLASDHAEERGEGAPTPVVPGAVVATRRGRRDE